MAVLTYKCPNCNGPLTWNGQKEKFVCEYCSSAFTEAELAALAPTQAQSETVDAETGRDGGLTKLGAGTLTLETAPKYTGWTTVKAGKLVVPAGTALDVVAGAGGEIEGATTNNLAFTEGYTFNTGTDQTIVAAGEADVSNLTVYIANPDKGSPVTIVRAGSITGTPTMAFPEGTGEKDKAKWSLRIKNGTLKASAGSPLFVIIR